LIKAIFASSPAVVGLDILVAVLHPWWDQQLSMQAQYGTRRTGKRLKTLKKYRKEQQDSFSIIIKWRLSFFAHTHICRQCMYSMSILQCQKAQNNGQIVSVEQKQALF
jgi:hypothetical protein